MTTTIRNSAYKVKAGSIPNAESLAKLKLEEGGIFMYDNRLFWVDENGIHPVYDPSNMKLRGTDIINALTDTPALLDYFDTEVYDRSPGLTSNIPGQTVTVATDGKVIFTRKMTIKSSVAGMIVLIKTFVDAVEHGTERIELPDAATNYDFEYTELVDVLTAEVITFQGSILDTVATPNFTITTENTFSHFV
jgi:hypothetical protein